MIELAGFVLGWGVLASMAAVALAQLGWQGYRVATASGAWKLNALIGDPGDWRLLSLAHIGAAMLWLYVRVQAAR